MSVLDGAVKGRVTGYGNAEFYFQPYEFVWLPEPIIDEILRLRDGEKSLLARCAELELKLADATNQSGRDIDAYADREQKGVAT